MNRETPHTRVYKGALSVLLSTCLLVGMLPTYAYGDKVDQSGTEVGQRISEDVRVAPVDLSDTALGGASASDTVALTDEIEAMGTGGPNEQLDSNTQPQTSNQTAAEVPVAGGGIDETTLLVDGLKFTVDTEVKTATLTGWYGEAPKGDLSIPTQVVDGSTSYDVVALGTQVDQTSDQKRDASHKSLGGA